MTYKSKSYEHGFLDVEEGHKIYYEIAGNPKGKPILFLHGGPGGGFREKDKKYFNPKKFKIILFDQRGAGKSTPTSSIKNNTTQKLVFDIKKLLDHLKIKKTFLFGGSWGSTLALVYAINYPETISGIVLRGIFLASKKENNYFTYEAKRMYPEEWEKMTSIVPLKYIRKKKIEEYYYKMILSKNPKIREKYFNSWAEYEFSISCLNPNKKKIKKDLKSINKESFSTIELHYLNRNCFLPENYILKNVSKLNKIPIIIIHGRYDCICSPSAAYTLHKRLKNSTLQFVLSGHSSSDKEMERALVKATETIGKREI